MFILLFSLTGKHLDIGKFLLKSGAEPKLGCCVQNSLQNCRSNINTDSWVSFIYSLLQKGADPNKRTSDGSNLIECVQDRSSRLVEEMIKYGADVNFSDDMEKTALHYACDLGKRSLLSCELNGLKMLYHRLNNFKSNTPTIDFFNT